MATGESGKSKWLPPLFLALYQLCLRDSGQDGPLLHQVVPPGYPRCLSQQGGASQSSVSTSFFQRANAEAGKS